MLQIHICINMILWKLNGEYYSDGKMYSKFQTAFQINLCCETDLQIRSLQGQNVS